MARKPKEQWEKENEATIHGVERERKISGFFRSESRVAIQNYQKESSLTKEKILHAQGKSIKASLPHFHTARILAIMSNLYASFE